MNPTKEQIQWQAMRMNRERLKEGTNKFYQSIVTESKKPKVSRLPKDWRNRIFKRGAI